MDIIFLIVMGLVILFLVAASSRLGNNLGRINGKSEGWNDGESLRWLRESQEQARLEKEGFASPKSAQPGTGWSVAEPVSNFPGKAE